MSYIQGTKVRVIGEFKDPDTKQFEDPAEVIVTIHRPGDDDPTETRRYTDGDGKVGKISTGVYQTVIDTSPEYGDWVYYFEDPDKVVKTGTLRVRPRKPVVV